MKNDTAITVIRALADDVRLDMVRTLARKDRPVSGCDVVSACESLTKLAQPTASHHFRKLVEAGVLVETKDGVAKSYRLNRELLGSVGIDASKI